jgi:hypothetical protein
MTDLERGVLLIVVRSGAKAASSAYRIEDADSLVFSPVL